MHPHFKQSAMLFIALLLIVIASLGEQFNGAAAGVKAAALFDSPLPTVPNDQFVAAQPITTLPFHAEADISYATTEAEEPLPSCSPSAAVNQSAWYLYTATTSAALQARIEGNGILAIYKGNAINSLTPLQCLNFWSQGALQTQAGESYYFQVSNPYGSGGYIGLTLGPLPPVQASFYYNPSDPSIYESVWFQDNSYDPGNIGFQSGSWNFGDGQSSTEYSYIGHQFAQDGDYPVTHMVTTSDGRTASITRVVQVRTRDVYITKMKRPSSATVGQTKKLAVTLASPRYAQNIRVNFYKSVPGGFYQIGYLEQYVAANRKVDFHFSYTFTPDDAKIGKVTIKAVAVIVDGRDALPADNEFISLPITVKQRSGRSAAEIAADERSPEAVDEVSNQAADGPILSEIIETVGNKAADEGEAAYRAYMPLVNKSQ